MFWFTDTASKAAEAELRQKAKKELEDWHTHQQEQMEKNKVNNRYFTTRSLQNTPVKLKEYVLF